MLWRTPTRWYRVVPMALADFIRSNSTTEKAAGAALHASVSFAAADTTSSSIHENLAAEEALMRGITLHPGQCLLLYYVNTPCVVVGRNQNIFQEVALRRAAADGVSVSRRASGGGAVFHDEHNLCFSFITHRSGYAPEKTIQLVRLGLSTLYHIDPARLTTTGRHDLFLDGRKITGSAMRVQRDIAYHHCTLLVNTPHALLGRYLHPEGDYVDFRTSSVGSVRSPVTTLTESRCLPEVPDAVGQLKERMTDFFASQCSQVLSSVAPWDLDVPTLRRAFEDDIAAGADAPPLYRLDVRRAVDDDMPLTEADGRRYARGDAHTLGEAVQVSRSTQWAFAMPPFTSTVQVSWAELRDGLCAQPAWGDVVHLSSLSHEELLAELKELLFPENSEDNAGHPLRVQTTVEHRTITRVFIVRAGGRSSGAPGGSDVSAASPVEWLSRFFSTLLVDAPCDAAVKGVEAMGDSTVIVRGFLHEAGAAAPDLPDVAADAAALLAVKALLTLWRVKNVFDLGRGL